jgi:protein SCO1/2
MTAALLLALALRTVAAPAAGAEASPAALRDVDVVEHLGAALPDGPWRDEAGHVVELRDFTGGERPLLLVLAYYRCPMLCSLVLERAVGLVRSLDGTGAPPFQALTVSFDPRDTPEAAAARREQAGAAWPFLVGEPAAVDAFMRRAGVSVRYDAATDQYAHAAIWLVITPQGEVSRYLYGIAPPTQEVERALMEAAAGRTSTSLERILMRCFAWDPAKRKFAATVHHFFAAGAAVILGLVGATLLLLWRADRRRGAP